MINVGYRVKRKKNYICRSITKRMVVRDVGITVCEGCSLDYQLLGYYTYRTFTKETGK